MTPFQVEYPFDKTDIFRLVRFLRGKKRKQEKNRQGKENVTLNIKVRWRREEDGGNHWESKGKKRYVAARTKKARQWHERQVERSRGWRGQEDGDTRRSSLS